MANNLNFDFSALTYLDKIEWNQVTDYQVDMIIPEKCTKLYISGSTYNDSTPYVNSLELGIVSNLNHVEFNVNVNGSGTGHLTLALDAIVAKWVADGRTDGYMFVQSYPTVDGYNAANVTTAQSNGCNIIIGS